MNQGIKKRWVAALKSGVYEQTRNKLKRKSLKTQKYAFCPLGVLMDLYSIEKNIKWEANDGDFFSIYQSVGSLPFLIQDWAGLREGNPQLGGSSVIGRNDCCYYSFEQIAEEIEKHH